MSWSVLPSQGRIKSMVKAASLSTGISEADICFRRYKDAVRARHAIWRELHEAGFGYSSIGKSWGVDHTTVHYALNGKPSQPAKRLAA